MEKIQRSRNCRKSGSMLALALVIVLVLAIVGAGLIRLGLNARLQAIKDVMQISSRSAADAGIEHAMRYMIDQWNSSANKGAWIASWEDTTDWTNPALPATAIGYTSPVIQLGSDTYGSAKFQYTIYKSTRLKGYQIVSKGTAGSETRTVHAAAILKSSLFGVGAKEEINLQPKVNLQTIPTGLDMTIQTNSVRDKHPFAINLQPGITVPGDVICGPGGDPLEAIDYDSKKVTIEGQVMAAEQEIEFPPVYFPDYPDGTVTVLKNPVTGIDEAYIGATELDPVTGKPINIAATTNIKLSGLDFDSSINNLYICGDVNIAVVGNAKLWPNGSEGNLIVTSGSSLDLYLGGDLNSKSKYSIIYENMLIYEDPATTDEPSPQEIIDAAKRISIKGTVDSDGNPLCTNINFQPNGNFYGTIYAPDAHINLQPGQDFYGAVVGGESVNIQPGGSYYYVPELINTQDIEVLYMGIKFGSWWEEAN